MNTADGMSNEELDIWADIFYRARIGGVTEVSFSQFISSPFMHLNSPPQRMNQPKNEKSHLRLAYSSANHPRPA